jgi:hypothetical protein
MGSSDFYIDYNIEVSGTSNGFTRETEQGLRKLASDYFDMVGEPFPRHWIPSSNKCTEHPRRDSQIKSVDDDLCAVEIYAA